MAQVGDLVVTGSSRFLNKINGVCTDGTSGTTKYMRQDGTWQVPPNDNTTYTLDVNGNNIRLKNQGGTVISTVTAPYADSTSSASKLSNWYTSRPTSMNVSFGDGAIRSFKATSSTTTGKPDIGDANIIHLSWDNTGGWDSQIAVGTADGMMYRYQSSGTWQSWRRIIDNQNIGSQSVNYATSAGNAATATNVAWTGVTGKPSTFAPSAHDHSQIVTVGDKRSTATTPNDYGNKIIFQGLKNNATIGSPSSNTYAYLIGLRGWSDSSGGDSHELAFHNTGISWRHGATTSWNNWQNIVITSQNGQGGTTTPIYIDANGHTQSCSYTIATSVPANAKFTDTTYTVGVSGNNVTLTPSSGSAQSITVPYATKAGSATDSTKLPLAGGTMTGELKTSFKSAVAMGSRVSDATTIENLVTDVRYSSGCCGSFSLSSAYTLDGSGVTIPTGWYNYLWIPHRSGGVNGAASGDNCNYGSLYLSGMTRSGFYMIRFASSVIAEVKNLYSDNNTNYYHKTGSWSGLTYTAAKVGSPEDLAFTIPTGTSATTVAVGNHTHNYAGSSSAGGAATSLANFAVSTTTGLAVENTTNIHGYVSGLTKADWNYQQADGAIYAQFYSASWKHQIYGDYRTGHISLRGKNNGTWQNWLRVLDEGNYTTFTVKKDGTGASGSWGISVTGSSASCTGNAATATTASNIVITATNPSSSTGYNIPFITGTYAQAASNVNNGLTYYTKEGTTTATGAGTLQLGNNTSTGTAGNKTGWLRLFSEKNGYAELGCTSSATNSTTHYLPNTGGTLLNTGTTSFTQTLTSGTKIGSIKINGTSKDLFAPSGGGLIATGTVAAKGTVTYDLTINNNVIYFIWIYTSDTKSNGKMVVGRRLLDFIATSDSLLGITSASSTSTTKTIRFSNSSDNQATYCISSIGA